MAVEITFQGPDFNSDRNPLIDFQNDSGIYIKAAGFDLDFSVVTIYPYGEEMDENLTLAHRAPYMNENGDECGEIGWKILPEPRLLQKMPELAQHIGKQYGRIIVTSEGS